MIYSSYDFLLLLPPLVLWFYSLRGILAQNILLLVASIVFLAWTNVWNLLPAARDDRPCVGLVLGWTRAGGGLVGAPRAGDRCAGRCNSPI